MWESKTDWNIFRDLAKVTSEAAAKYFPEPQKDIVAAPIAHDSPGEISQPTGHPGLVPGECEPVLGKTMHNLTVVNRDYTKLYDKFISLGRSHQDVGPGGARQPLRMRRRVRRDGRVQPLPGGAPERQRSSRR